MRKKIKALCIPLLLIVGACTSEKPFTFNSKIDEKSVQWNEVGEYKLSDVESAMDQRLKVVRSILEPQLDPYKGLISNPEKCLLKNLPPLISEQGHSSHYRAMSLYSSEGQILGQCPDSDRLLKTQYLLLYCSSTQKLYSMKYFYPKNKPWIEEPVAICN